MKDHSLATATQEVRHSLRPLGGAALGLLLALSACDQPPQQERREAVAACEEARHAEARSLAGDPFQRAETALHQGDAELERQARRFALWRRYRLARELYNEAIQAARHAQRLSEARRIRQMAEAKAAEEKTRGDLAELERAIAAAPIAAREGLRRRLASIQEETGRAAQAQSAGDGSGARAILETARQQLASLRRDLRLPER